MHDSILGLAVLFSAGECVTIIRLLCNASCNQMVINNGARL